MHGSNVMLQSTSASTSEQLSNSSLLYIFGGSDLLTSGSSSGRSALSGGSAAQLNPGMGAGSDPYTGGMMTGNDSLPSGMQVTTQQNEDGSTTITRQYTYIESEFIPFDDEPDPDDPDEPESPNEPDTPDSPVDPLDPAAPEEPKPDYESPSTDVPVIIDPSGYVYEAVETNRVSGATVQLYFKSAVDTPDDEAVCWNAGDYGQENPLTTDALGQYMWMVGSGYYKVIVSSEGYETAESDWLPVPPVQTDVNLALVSRKAPAIIRAAADCHSITVLFDRYVRADTEWIDGIRVVNSSDEEVPCGYKEHPDLVWSESYGALSREFVLVFEEEQNIGEELTVRFDNVTSYAGVSAQNLMATATVAPAIGSVSILSDAAGSSGTTLSLRMRATAPDGTPIPSARFALKSATASLVEADAEALSDQNGEIVFDVRLLKAGQGILQLASADGGYTQLIRIEISNGAAMSAEYVSLCVEAENWYGSLLATWSDGAKESDAQVEKYIDDFALVSARVREAAEKTTPDQAEEHAQTLQDWDESIAKVLRSRQNKLLTSEDQQMIHSILFSRVEMENQLLQQTR